MESPTPKRLAVVSSRAVLEGESRTELIDRYRSGAKRLLFLDYDGTLVGYSKRPEEALPPEGVLGLLARLHRTPGTKVVIVSGRDKGTLQTWFGDLGIDLIAEHGAWIRRKGRDWSQIHPLSGEWKPAVRPMLELFADRLPGAFVEEKELSLAWHYRETDPEHGPAWAQVLMDDLVDFTAHMDVKPFPGNKVIEIHNAGVDKGAAALHWIGRRKFDFLFAAGDDWTDEDLFQALPRDAWTVRVGLTQSHARFHVRTHEEILSLLDSFSEGERKEKTTSA